jgi:hypothetical protein
MTNSSSVFFLIIFIIHFLYKLCKGFIVLSSTHDVPISQFKWNSSCAYILEKTTSKKKIMFQKNFTLTEGWGEHDPDTKQKVVIDRVKTKVVDRDTEQ